jgi:hypothetical protein
VRDLWPVSTRNRGYTQMDLSCQLVRFLGLSLVAALQLPASAYALTSKEVYEADSHSIVKVVCLDDAKPPAAISVGTGFVVSNTSTIVTANHVVTLEPARNVYCPHISVISYEGKSHAAAPIFGSKPLPSAMAHDYAVLKTEPLKVAALKLGTWSSAVPGDDLTTFGFAFDPPSPLLLSLTTSGVFGLPGNNVIVFQGPNNKGFSGAPVVLNRTGEVIGIVDNKIIGITPELESQRAAIMDPRAPHIQMGNFDPSKATLDLINILDQSLISGMGVAFAIDYAKDAAQLPP